MSLKQTTHTLLNEEEHLQIEIKDGLIRFSLRIEEAKHLIEDI